MAWCTPLEGSTHSASRPGKEGGSRAAGWTHSLVHLNHSLCGWSACQLTWVEATEQQQVKEKKIEKQMRTGEAPCKEQDRGMLREYQERGGKVEDRGLKDQNIYSPNTQPNWKSGELMLLCLFEFSFLWGLGFCCFLVRCMCFCWDGRKWREGASQKPEDRKISQGGEPRYMEEAMGADNKGLQRGRGTFFTFWKRSLLGRSSKYGRAVIRSLCYSEGKSGTEILQILAASGMDKIMQWGAVLDRGFLLPGISLPKSS